MSQRSDALEEQLSEAQSRVSIWKTLLDHLGWKTLLEELGQENYTRQTVVCSTPLNPDSNIYAQEFIKGQFSGVEHTLQYPVEQLEAAKREVALLTKQLENENEIEARIPAYESRVDTPEYRGDEPGS